MIKTFKDFDSELKSQKIYEAEDINGIQDEDMDAFDKLGIKIPEMISDNKFLLKISRIVLKKLKNSGLGTFGLHPLVVNINDVPGVYVYNYDDPSMNIVVCRNTQGKHVYLFREFNMGVENVADLVLSTTKLGFSDIVDAMISNLTPSNIDEAWSHNDTYTKFTDQDVEKIKLLDDSIRSKIVKLYTGGASINAVYNTIRNNSKYKHIKDAIEKEYGNIRDKTIQKVATIFGYALGLRTTGDLEMDNNIKDILIGISSSETDDDEDDILIKTSSAVSAKLDDSTLSEYDEKRKKIIEEDTKEFMADMDQIYDVATIMCKYVKQNGVLDKDDWGIMRKRGLLITGKAGAGKSYSIKKSLKDNHMKENIDYIYVSSGSTASQSLYKRLYDYNGKLVIFDDSAGLFDAQYKVAFWKNALEPNLANAVVELSADAKDGEKIGNNIYVPGKLTRQERYYAEVGASSRKEKKEFLDNTYEKLLADFLKEKGEDYVLSSGQINILRSDAHKLWKEYEEKKKPKMPNRFNYKGVVIVISNKTREMFQKEVGGVDDWLAIDRRMRNFDLHPLSLSMWAQIKKDILRQSDDTSITDEERMIPLDMVKEFINEVESLMESPQYQNINFGIISDDMCKILHSKSAKPTWKSELKKLMHTKK